MLMDKRTLLLQGKAFWMDREVMIIGGAGKEKTDYGWKKGMPNQKEGRNKLQRYG